MMVVIADAGPLIALSRINQLELLKTLFQDIIITQTVHDELLINHHQQGKTALNTAIQEGWISVQQVDNQGWQPVNPGVDAGEASAIYLACQNPAKTLLIIDDKAGRAEANYHRINIVGTAAIIAMAQQQGHIKSARDTLQALRDNGYYIGEHIINHVLQNIEKQA